MSAQNPLTDQLRHEVAKVVDSIDRAETNRVVNLLFDKLIELTPAQRAAWFYLEVDGANARAAKRRAESQRRRQQK